MWNLIHMPIFYWLKLGSKFDVLLYKGMQKCAKLIVFDMCKFAARIHGMYFLMDILSGSCNST